jgi:hypothetical protein
VFAKPTTAASVFAVESSTPPWSVERDALCVRGGHLWFHDETAPVEDHRSDVGDH